MKKKNSQAGIAFVEFAIILPLLLLITFGTIEFGLLMFNKQIITNASREGARAGIVASTERLPYTGTPSITSVVLEYCSNHLITFRNPEPPKVIIKPIPYDKHAAFQVPLTVKVTYKYSWLAPIWGTIGIPDPLTIAAETTMKYE